MKKSVKTASGRKAAGGKLDLLPGLPYHIRKHVAPLMERYGLELIAAFQEVGKSWRLLLIDMDGQCHLWTSSTKKLYLTSLGWSVGEYARESVSDYTKVWHGSGRRRWFDKLDEKIRWIENLETQRPRVKWLKGGVR